MGLLFPDRHSASGVRPGRPAAIRGPPVMGVLPALHVVAAAGGGSPLIRGPC